MSRRPSAPTQREPRSAQPAGRAWSPWRLAITVLVGALLGAAAFFLRRSPSTHSVTAAVPTAAKPAAAALSYPQLVALADSVKRFQAARRFGEALPGARRLLDQHELRGHLGSSMLVDYARMLNNAAFESGAGAPRSSFERIALEQRALVSTQAALGMAKTPREKAEAITFLGLVHEAWGFPYDAYHAYRGALGVDPTYPIAIEHFEAFGGRLVPVRIAR